MAEVHWLSKICLDEFKGLDNCIALVLFYGSWNRAKLADHAKEILTDALSEASQGLVNTNRYAATIQIDECDDTLEFIIGDGENVSSPNEAPPMNMPCLCLMGRDDSGETVFYQHLTGLSHFQLMECLSNDGSSNQGITKVVRRSLMELEDKMDLTVAPEAISEVLRIFVAGDRSSVGKSSVCLGIMGNLVASGYDAADLAYIKPATQSESTQLIEKYCTKHGIRCVPIGPLVYYRGFTRAFLAGETEPSEELLAQCSRAVDRVSRNRKVVLIDGVGFPAVGSICGTDNAQVCKACSVPGRPSGVLLVGGVGVGAAVDAYNLNATYFRNAQVPVLGAVFNKLPLDGFYSLENCKAQVGSYFDQYGGDQQAFGFVPLFPEIVGPNGMDHVDDFITAFGAHVNIEGILEAGRKISGTGLSNGHIPVKRRKITKSHLVRRTRAEIESVAIKSGAKKSA